MVPPVFLCNEVILLHSAFPPELGKGGREARPKTGKIGKGKKKVR
jgi:hypothetical protein